MRLYYSPNSCALASHILLEEVDANYSIAEINFKEKIPITHHLIELKNRLIQVTLVVAVFFGVCF